MPLPEGAPALPECLCFLSSLLVVLYSLFSSLEASATGRGCYGAHRADLWCHFLIWKLTSGLWTLFCSLLSEACRPRPSVKTVCKEDRVYKALPGMHMRRCVSRVPRPTASSHWFSGTSAYTVRSQVDFSLQNSLSRGDGTLCIFQTIDISSPEFRSITTNILFFIISVDGRNKCHVPVQYAH